MGKKEVALFAIQHSIQDATAKYSLPHSTVNYWVKLMNDPRACQLCGKEFANDSTVRRHIEQVHRNTPEGIFEQERKRKKGKCRKSKSWQQWQRKFLRKKRKNGNWN